MQAPFFSFCSFTSHQGDFPGGPVVKNLPANAGDSGSSPGLSRSHMPWSDSTRAPQLPSLCSEPGSHSYRAHVLQLLKSTHPGAPALQQRSHCYEKPTHRSQRAAHACRN